MVILVPLVVLLLVAALFVAGGSTLGGGDRFFRSGTGLPLAVIGMVAATVVGIAVAGLFLVGARGVGDDGSSDRDAPRSGVETVGDGKAADDNARDEKPAGQPAEPVLAGAGPDVSVSAGTMSARPVDRLADGAVLRVTASGFEPGSAGEVAQCVVTRDGARSCVNRFPVQFDGRGVARFQYLLSDRVRPAGRCGATDPPCILVVSDRVGGVQASTLTVFHDPAPLTGRVTVGPRSGLSKGDVVTVRASGFPPHTGIVATQCPEAPEGGRCEPGVSARTGPGRRRRAPAHDQDQRYDRHRLRAAFALRAARRGRSCRPTGVDAHLFLGRAVGPLRNRAAGRRLGVRRSGAGAGRLGGAHLRLAGTGRGGHAGDGPGCARQLIL